MEMIAILVREDSCFSNTAGQEVTKQAWHGCCLLNGSKHLNVTVECLQLTGGTGMHQGLACN